MMRYPMRIFHDANESGGGEDGYSVFFPGLGGSDVGIWSCGDTLDEARRMAVECLEGYLLSVLAHRQLPPDPGPLPEGDEWEWCYPNPSIAAAVEIRKAREASGMTQAHVARQLGITQQSYAALEDPERDGFSLNTLQRVALALGRQLNFSLEPESRSA